MTRCLTGKKLLWCAGIAAVLLFLCSKSSPLFAFNDWMDANIFFTMGKSMFSGRVLYRDVFDHKGPVLYFLYGIGWLMDHTGFTGVLILEVAAFAVFLAVSLDTVALFTAKAPHPAWAVLPAAGIAASRAFSHGGSAEEFLLPFLAVALYGLLRTVHRRQEMPLAAVLEQGILAGCALWLKYTVLGFYLVWVAVLAALYLRQGRTRALARSCGAYLAGMALAMLPWVVYFGVHGALDDWFTAYFYDNLFLYTGNSGGATALPQHLWWAVRDALPAAGLTLLFLVGALAARRRAVAGGVCLLAAGLALTSLMGGYLVYYGLVLAVFAPLGLVPLVRLAARVEGKRPVRMLLPWAGLAAAAAFAWLASPNAPLRGRGAESLPQLRFAWTMAADEEASLLNYGTLDGGFYTASGLLPPGRYFCVTNMPLEAQWTEQNRLLQEGTVTYVVALVDDLEQRFPSYHCIDEASYDGGEGTVTWYLYRRA